MKDRLLAVGILALLGLIFSKRASASNSFGPVFPITFPFEGDNVGDETVENPFVDANSNLRAFLYMIRAAEHYPGATDAERYSTFYGGGRFVDMTDHPVLTGELRGVRLTDRQCADAGFGPGCVSTAAGAYQIIRPTWQRVRQAGAWGGYLPDFGAESQDEAARRILFEIGALPMIEAGMIEDAIILAGSQWASLPGSSANQNPKSMQVALSLFNQGLG